MLPSWQNRSRAFVISVGVFPNNCKITKLKPLYKKVSKTDPVSYRSLIIKIMYDFKDVNVNKCQSRFRYNHFAKLCLSFFNNKILKGFDKELLTGMILKYDFLYIQFLSNSVTFQLLYQTQCIWPF